jgi:hypothetical protein
MSIRVPHRYASALEDGLNAYMEKTGLKLSEVKRSRTGNKGLSKKTIDSYKKHYDGLYRFAAMIGSYDTCFALSYYAPSDFCPSADADDVSLYMKYKTQPKGDHLTKDGQPVLDSLGIPVVCTGDWKDPGNSYQFLSAMSRIHRSINQRDSYSETCDACVESYKNNNLSTGCHHHPGRFMVWRRGNPRTSETVQNALHSAKANCSSHVVKGSYPLLPQEVRAIRDNLLSSGKSEDLQLFCIMLTSIYLFLRHDECHKIKVEDFRPEYSSVEQHRVNHLCVQIKGKTDNVPKNMITINNRFKHILNNDVKLTTHSFRKTGYLFAMWGGMDLQQAKVAARHSSDTMAQRYAGCSRFLLESAEARDSNARYQVGRFKMAINITLRADVP